MKLPTQAALELQVQDLLAKLPFLQLTFSRLSPHDFAHINQDGSRLDVSAGVSVDTSRGEVALVVNEWGVRSRRFSYVILNRTRSGDWELEGVTVDDRDRDALRQALAHVVEALILGAAE